jgi:hypothetical protein
MTTPESGSAGLTNAALHDASDLPPCQNIDGVIDRLTRIIDAATIAQNRLGYFAVLYRAMTIAVRDGIGNGQFNNAELMERLDVIFANRYFSALGAHFAGKQTPRSWGVAFEAASTARATIVQHLLLGVNAHINYDLGLAAAATLPEEDLPKLQPDFEEINRVIAAVHVDVQRNIDAVSPFQGLIDMVGGRSETAIIKFSMNAARKAAWGAACAAAEPNCTPSFAGDLDESAARLGTLVLHPARPISLALRIVKLGERRSVPQVIAALS